MAVIELVESGNGRPTVAEVAAQAGVSVRSVYWHFGDAGRLFTSAAELQSSRNQVYLSTIPPGAPIDVRVGFLCHQRRQLFEAMHPVMPPGHGGGGPFHQAVMTECERDVRHQLASALHPEIAARGEAGWHLFESLHSATGWQTWQTLRMTGRTAKEAEQHMLLTVRALLANSSERSGTSRDHSASDQGRSL